MNIKDTFLTYIHFPFYCIIFFAFFTLCYHIFLFCRATFTQLCIVGIPLTIVFTLTYICIHRRLRITSINISQQPCNTTNQYIKKLPTANIVISIIACIIVLIYFYTKSYLLVWIISVFFLLLTLFFDRRKTNITNSQIRSIDINYKDLLTLFCLSFLYAVLAFIVKRTDADDAMYVAVAVHLINVPYEKLFQTDPLFHNTNFRLWPYHFESFNVLSAVIAILTGWEPGKVSHYILAIIASILYPLAWFRFFICLDFPPRKLFFPFLILSLFLAETHASFGNLTFVRFFQGKTLIIGIIIPLLYVSVWDFVNSQRVISIINTLLFSIAAIGCTSSAIFIVPQVIVLALLSTYPFLSIRKMFLFAFPILCYYGIWIILFLTTITPSIKNAPFFNIVTEYTINCTLGDTQKFIVLFFILTSWMYICNLKKRHILLLVTILFFVFPLNPYITHILRKVIAPGICWREIWTIPLWGIACIGLYGITSILSTVVVTLFRQCNHHVITYTLLGSFVLLMLPFSTLKSSNFERVGIDSLWYPSNYENMLSAIDKHLPSGQTIIAPPDLSCWLTTFKKRYNVLTHRYVFVADNADNYVTSLYNMRIVNFINTDNPSKEEHIFFIQWLKDISPEAIVLRSSSVLHEELQQLDYVLLLEDCSGKLYLKNREQKN